MLDIAWSELLLIGIVALIVVGPKDLPKLFHSLGRMTAKARSMAREFSSAMDDAAKDSGLADAARSLDDVRGIASKKSLGLDALDKATERFEKWDPQLKSQRNPKGAAADPRGATPDPAAPAPAAKAPAGDGPSGSAPAAPSARPATAGTGSLRPRTSPQTAASADASGNVEAGRSEHPTGQRRLHAVRRRDTKDA